MVENNNNKDLKENNIIKVTNNNVKYYENLTLQHSKEAAKSATKSAGYANDAKGYLNSCQLLKNTIDDETVQIVKLHSDNMENPHNVTASQVGAYTKTELDNLLEDKLSKKNQTLVAGENVVITDNEDGSQTIKSTNTVALDYQIADNKPLINGVVLSGDKTSHDLGLASIEEIPTHVSELENDAGYLSEHQDISGKQDLLTSGDGILISDNEVSTINRADTDLSNLTDAGKNVIDGVWVVDYLKLCTNVKTKGSYQYDISEYLPDRNYTYEIRVNLYATDDHTSSDKNVWSAVGTSENPYSQEPVTTNGIVKVVTDTYVDKADSTGTLVFTPDNRTMHLEIAERNLTNGANIELYGYRRLGTNE